MDVNISSYTQSSGYYNSYKGLKKIEKKVIKKYFKGKVLDLGCGCGRTTVHLDKMGLNVISVDIIPDMIKIAKKKYPSIKFFSMDACKLAFKDKSVDTVFFSYNGIDYIHPEVNRIKALKEVERVLKDGGLFIYSSHNPWALPFTFRPKFLLRNILRGTLFSRYKWDKESFGELYTYYGSPSKQRSLIESTTSLRFIEMVRNGFRDVYPHYIFVKPEGKK